MSYHKIISIVLLILLSHTSAVVLGQTIKPTDYESFKPPAADEWFTDPAFGTQIKRLTNTQSVFGFNGERSMFSSDDQYFVIAVDLPTPKRLHLFDGRTGDLIRILPDFVSDRTTVRWWYDEVNEKQLLVYAEENRLMGFNVENDGISTLATFDEVIGDATGKLCGGDGNDFDDSGEWLMLNKGTLDANGLPSKMFAYNISTGETGPVKDMTSYLLDYCTISPGGGYIVGTSFDPAGSKPGVGKKWIWNRDWTNEREITNSDGSRIGNAHLDLAYLDGIDECLVTKLSGGIWAIRFSDLEHFKILDASDLSVIMYSAVGGSNRNHIYIAVESKGLDPDVEWSPYLGELLQIPLVSTGSGTVRRLTHHRARTHDNSFHFFADQPEPWINHTGDRLFFRSNMDNYSEKGKNDLYMMELIEPITFIKEQWTFDGANPEIGNNNTTMPVWTTASPNSVPFAGVLRYATNGPSGQQTSLPDIDTSIIDQLIVTFDVADLYVDKNDTFRYKLVQAGGSFLEIKLTTYSTGLFSPEIFYGSTKVFTASGTDVNFTNDFPSGLGAALRMVTTFDFKNSTVSFVVSGAGAANFKNTSWTEDVVQDMSVFIPEITAVQIQTSNNTDSNPWNTWIDFDRMTIGTKDITPPSLPVITGATETKVTGTAEANSTITVYAEDGTTVIDKGITNVSGNYTVNFTTSQLVGTVIKVSAKDTSNNESLKTEATLSDSNLSVDKISDNNLHIYPNPFEDHIYIKSIKQLSNYQYRIINMSGKRIQEGLLVNNTIDCSSLQSGVFLLKIFSQGESHNIKIVKN